MKTSTLFRLPLVLALALGADSAHAQSLIFKDVTTFARVGMPTDPEGYGHGVAVADFTGDGRPDIYLVAYAAGNSLFRNNGNGRFTDIAASAGVREGSAYDRGVAAADYDNDGRLDLYLTAGYGANNLLYHNEGNNTFAEVARRAGVELNNFQGQGVSWGDYDSDGDLDLFLPSYENASRLFRQDAQHNFEDVTEAAGLGNTTESVQAVFFDLDFDDDLDLFVSRGRGFANRMFINQGRGRFQDEAATLHLDDPNPHGQGVTVADYDCDGDFDIYMCDSEGANRLYRNEGPRFREAAQPAGVADASRSLGCTFADFDNDGWLDLYVGNFGRNKMYRNNGDGTFTNVSASSGTDHPDRAYGLVAFDYDEDGRLDIFFGNSGQPSALLRNESAAQQWLKIALAGKESNRNGVGALVRVEAGAHAQTQQLIAGHSMVSGGALTLHFGLGANAQVERVAVQWPSGKKDVLLNVEAGRALTIIEGSFGETPLDTLAPEIANLAAIVKSDTSALLTWSTNEPAAAQVEYGLTPAYGDTTATSRELSARHALLLRGLQAQATYHYRVLAQDGAGNRAASPDFEFTLAPESALPAPLKVRAQNLAHTSAEVIWRTNEAATAWLEFGSDSSMNRRAPALTANGRSHLAALTGLTPNTTYHGRAFARTFAHELLASRPFTFTTLNRLAATPEPTANLAMNAAEPTLAEKKNAAPELPQNFSLSHYPNPLRAAPGASIHFALPRAAEVDLAVLDLNGRLVQQLAAAPYPAGAHQLRWSGAASAGRSLAPGLYFVRLRSRALADHVASTLVRRLMLLP